MQGGRIKMEEKLVVTELGNVEVLNLHEKLKKLNEIENLKNELEAQEKTLKNQIFQDLEDNSGEYEDEKYQVSIKTIKQRRTDTKQIEQILIESDIEIPYKEVEFKKLQKSIKK